MRPARFFFLIGIFLTLLILSACGTPATATPLSATLSELQGSVGLKQPGSADFVQASGGAWLDENGQVQTGDDGRARLDLSTGTIIRMAPSSMFTLLSNDETGDGLATKLRLDLGEIFIILNGGSMDVETPSGVASVRGSYMSVWVDPDTLNVYVTCLEGDCHAENEAGDADFGDGERTILFRRNPDGTYTVPEVEDMTEDDFQRWLDENPEAREVWEQAVGTMTALAPTDTPEPTLTPVPPPTDTPVPTNTNVPPTVRPTKRRPPPDEPPACSESNNQWDNPGAPCFCDPYDYEETNPPYCYGSTQ
jgi:hypothetical protein